MASIAGAQDREDVNAGQFDFSLPGAPSLAMGGAFLAIAHDATAAYSNPAGLTFLTEPEVSIEGRSWSFTNFAFDTGHAFGDPSGIGVDTVAGLQQRGYTADASGPSFVSVVYPRKDWAIGFFRHEIPSFRTRKEIQGPFFDCTGGFRTDRPPSPPFCLEDARDDGIDRTFPRRQEIEIDIASLGVSFAYRLNPSLSLGISTLFYDFNFLGRNRVYDARGEKFFAPPDFSDSNIELESFQDGNDSAFGLNLGFVWDTRYVSVGGAFRQGPEFDYQLTRKTGPAHPSVVTRIPPLPVGRIVGDKMTTFNLPDTWGLGVAYRPTETFVISLQLDRVLFSQLTKDFRDVDRPSVEEAAALNASIRTDDVTRIRLGVERLILSGSKIFALRAGAWHDPDHRTRFEVSDSATGFPGPRWSIILPQGEDQTHLTAGFGVVFLEHAQLDAAVDSSDVVDTYSLSMVWRFQRGDRRKEATGGGS